MIDSGALLPRDVSLPGTEAATKSRLWKDILFIAAGPLSPNPAELLASEACSSTIRQLAATCDYLIIDGPPILLVSDALELASKVDEVVLVARLRSTKIEEARKTRDGLEKMGIKPLGVVVAGVARSKSYYHQYGGYYNSAT